MTEQEIKKIVISTMEQAGIKIPVEIKYDTSGLDKPEKMCEFIGITAGDYTRAFYVQKGGNCYDSQYYDLMFAVNPKGEPICVPVPLARKILACEIDKNHCRGILNQATYETIYSAYYKQRDKMPF